MRYWILGILSIFMFMAYGCAKPCNVKRGMSKLEVIEACGEPNEIYSYVFRNEERWEYNIGGSFYHIASKKVVLFNKNGEVIFFDDGK